MQFGQPIPFADGIKTLKAKHLTPSAMNTKEWSAMPAAIRERAFFSARVEDVRFLQHARRLLRDYMERTVIETPGGKALKVSGRGDFVTQMKEFMAENGIDRDADETITDFGGSERLRLIFDTQLRMAYEFGNYKQSMTPEMLHQFPAWRFFRGTDVEAPREVHDAHAGEVRLKTDTDFWLAMNAPELGGFAVPYGPWGFGSGMEVEDVGRDEAVALGLLADGETPTPEDDDPQFNEGMSASGDGLDEDLSERLKDELGSLDEAIES